MADQVLITKADLTTITVIQKNVEVSLVEPFIDVAQNIHTKGLLGTPLYEALINNVTLTGDTYTAADTDLNNLLDQVRPSLCYWAFYEGMPFLWARVTNKGLVFKNSENSQPLSKSDMIELRKTVNNWAENYDNEVLTFLRDNLSLYPLFGNCTTDNRQKRPLKYFSGIQF
jgi:hypothetical protein